MDQFSHWESNRGCQQTIREPGCVVVVMSFVALARERERENVETPSETERERETLATADQRKSDVLRSPPPPPVISTSWFKEKAVGCGGVPPVPDLHMQSGGCLKVFTRFGVEICQMYSSAASVTRVVGWWGGNKRAPGSMQRPKTLYLHALYRALISLRGGKRLSGAPAFNQEDECSAHRGYHKVKPCWDLLLSSVPLIKQREREIFGGR